MSAFLVSNRHIDALVYAARRVEREMHVSDLAPRTVRPHPSGGHFADAMTDDELGRWLLRGNMASLVARYPRTKARPDGEVIDEEALAAYRYGGPALHVWTAVELLKAVHCYAYQANEVRDWEESDVRRFCDRLADALTHLLPGYDAAPWGL